MTTSRTRMITIGFAVVGGIVAIALVVIPRHHSPRHSPVARYITSVDTVEARMTFALGKVEAAYQAVTARHSMTPATAKQLVAAETTLRTLETRIASLEAPSQATKLRALLLRLVRQETAVTHEVGTFVRFLPRFDAVLADLRVASTRLAHRVAAATAPTPQKIHGTPAQIKQVQAAFVAASTKAALDQADAMSAYDSALARLTRRLRALSPPPVLKPAYGYQLTSLGRTAAAGARLAAALRATARTNVPQLSRAFAVASRLSQSTAEQRAEVAAVKAYDARLRAIGTTAAAIHTELVRLQALER